MRITEKRRLESALRERFRSERPSAGANAGHAGAVAALAAVVCAVTFTGARDRSAESHSLTGDELTYFNTEFFNGDTGNFHNQFLSCLYESPADIDLFDLLYDGEEAVEPNEITERYVRRLEAEIVAQPELWIWSHRRWKHKRTNVNG